MSIIVTVTELTGITTVTYEDTIVTSSNTIVVPVGLSANMPFSPSTSLGSINVQDAIEEVDGNKVDNTKVLTDVPTGAIFTDSIYSHPTSDGNVHVPSNGDNNLGKVLTSSSTAGVYTWETNADTDTTYTAGSNVSIDSSNSISSTYTDTTYTAGTGVYIGSDNVVSKADDLNWETAGTVSISEVQSKLVLEGTCQAFNKVEQKDNIYISFVMASTMNQMALGFGYITSEDITHQTMLYSIELSHNSPGNALAYLYVDGNRQTYNGAISTYIPTIYEGDNIVLEYTGSTINILVNGTLVHTRAESSISGDIRAEVYGTGGPTTGVFTNILVKSFNNVSNTVDSIQGLKDLLNNKQDNNADGLTIESHQPYIALKDDSPATDYDFYIAVQSGNFRIYVDRDNNAVPETPDPLLLSSTNTAYVFGEEVSTVGHYHDIGEIPGLLKELRTSKYHSHSTLFDYETLVHDIRYGILKIAYPTNPNYDAPANILALLLQSYEGYESGDLDNDGDIDFYDYLQFYIYVYQGLQSPDVELWIDTRLIKVVFDDPDTYPLYHSAGYSNTEHSHTTVNGKTVESNVPINAEFTDTDTIYSAGSNISIDENNVISTTASIPGMGTFSSSGYTRGSIFDSPNAATGNIKSSVNNVYFTKHLEFFNPLGSVGSVRTYFNSTYYITASDYRLKENVAPILDASDRILDLKPCRFNFISSPGGTVDGFLAHEVETVVPEAIVGEKDGEEMQGIDQSKLVPLLVAGLQDALKRIETLEKTLKGSI